MVSQHGERFDAITYRFEELDRRFAEEQRAFAKCQACYDTKKVPLDGYLREEVKDHRNLSRPCLLCTPGSSCDENTSETETTFALRRLIATFMIGFNSAVLLYDPNVFAAFGLICGLGGFVALRRTATH